MREIREKMPWCPADGRTSSELKKYCIGQAKADKFRQMVQTVVDRSTVGEASLFRDTYLRAYQGMLLARVLDDKFASLYRGGKIHGGGFLGRGQEAFSVASGLGVREGVIF